MHMNKKNYQNVLGEIQGMMSKIRNINEAIDFNEEGYDDFNKEEQYPEEEEPQQEEPMEQDVNPEQEGMKELDSVGAVDQIRELTLKGMTKLCKTPEDPEFQALLKIFTICNKSVDTEDKNQQPQH